MRGPEVLTIFGLEDLHYMADRTENRKDTEMNMGYAMALSLKINPTTGEEYVSRIAEYVLQRAAYYQWADAANNTRRFMEGSRET